MAPYAATFYLERVAPTSHHDSQAMNPSLLANLVVRVTLAILGTILCWVPLRVLVRKGEFAAVVLIATVGILNMITVINSLLWSSDDYVHWVSGRGLCDVEVYLTIPLDTTYAAAVFALVRRLAGQVRVSTLPMANANLGTGDLKWIKRRSLLAQAVVIFTIPILQVAFTWFDLAQRFIVGTLVGCSAVYDNSWPKILVFDSPPTAFTLASIVYVYLTYTRYRAISQVTRHALGPRNTPAAASASRTRRRLYNMCIAILAVYLPLQVFYLVTGVRETLSAYHPYNYSQVHSERHDPGSPTRGQTPAGGVVSTAGGDSTSRMYPWSAILFVPSKYVPASAMYQAYIPILTTVAIFIFFGRGQEARVIYQQYTQYFQQISPRTWWPSLRRGMQRQTHTGLEEQGGTRCGPEAGARRLSSVSYDTGEHPDIYGVVRRSDEPPRRHARDIFPQPEPPVPVQPRRARTSHRQTHSYANAVGGNEAEPRTSSAASALSARSSPLESAAAVIGSMIPERTSSLRNNSGFRRFRISNLAPSLTLSTLPSLPSVMSSLGRRGKEKGGDKHKTSNDEKPKGVKKGRDGVKSSDDNNAEATNKTATETTSTNSDAGIELRTFSAGRTSDGNSEHDIIQGNTSRSSGEPVGHDMTPALALEPAQTVLPTTEGTPRMGTPVGQRVQEHQPNAPHHSMSGSIVLSDTASVSASVSASVPSSMVAMASRTSSTTGPNSPVAPRAAGPSRQPRPPRLPRHPLDPGMVSPPPGRSLPIGEPGRIPAWWNGDTVPTELPDLSVDSSTDDDTDPTPPPPFDPSIHSIQAEPRIARPLEWLPGYTGRETPTPAPRPTTLTSTGSGADRVRREEVRASTQASQARRVRAREQGSAGPASTPTTHRSPPSGMMVHPAFRNGVPQGTNNDRWRDSVNFSRPTSGQFQHQSQHQINRGSIATPTATTTTTTATASATMGFLSPSAVEGNPDVTVTADGEARVTINRDGGGGDDTDDASSIESFTGTNSARFSDGAEIGVAVPMPIAMPGAHQVRASIVTRGNRRGQGRSSSQSQQ